MGALIATAVLASAQQPGMETRDLPMGPGMMGPMGPGMMGMMRMNGRLSHHHRRAAQSAEVAGKAS